MMRKLSHNILGCIACAFFTVTAAFAQTPVIPDNFLWVDNSYKGIGTGAKEAPFSSINQAINSAKPGNTIIVKAGIYRESLKLSYAFPQKVLTLKAAPGEKVIVSGMKKITGWTKWENGIYKASCDFRPDTLYVNLRTQPLSREPDAGWWKAPSVEKRALIDPLNKVQLNMKLMKPEVYIWTQHGNNFFTASIKDINESGRIEIVSNNKWLKLTNNDKYYLQNHPSFINRSGEWAVKKNGNKFEVYLKPEKLEDLKNVETPVAGNTCSIYKSNNLIIDGIDFIGGKRNGISIKDSQNVKISNSRIYFNEGIGVLLRDTKKCDLSNNLIWRNKNGASVMYSSKIKIEENDIAFNYIDGLIVSWKSDDVLIQRNFIHDHLLWGHPDNMQTYRGVTNIKFYDNLFLTAGQSIMMEETTKGEFRGNMLVGCVAYMLIFGHSNAGDFKIYKNTLAYAGYGCMNLTWKGYDVQDNIFMTGHGAAAYSTKIAEDYHGSRNLFWNGEGLKRYVVLASPVRFHETLKEFQDVTGQDLNSIYANPKFRNGPAGFSVLDAGKLDQCTKSKLFIRRGPQGVKLGDNIEINFDGKLRKVIALDNDSITIELPLSKKPVKAYLVANWKDNTDFKLDLRHKKDSPAMTLGKGQTPIGSNIDIQAYKKGDFNGDGKRDIPEIPKELLK